MREKKNDVCRILITSSVMNQWNESVLPTQTAVKSLHEYYFEPKKHNKIIKIVHNVTIPRSSVVHNTTNPVTLSLQSPYSGWGLIQKEVPDPADLSDWLYTTHGRFYAFPPCAIRLYTSRQWTVSKTSVMATTTYNCQNPFKVQHVPLKLMGIFGAVKATCSHLDLVSTVKLMTAN